MPLRSLFDVEANGFLEDTEEAKAATRAWCIAAADVDTRERFQWGPEELPAALEHLAKADTLIAHNGQRYDVPLLIKLYDFKLKPGANVLDTMIGARLKHPNVKDSDVKLIQTKRMPPGLKYRGKHTIASWGYRLNIPKLHEDIVDWTIYDPSFLERCIGDVDTNLALWDYLQLDKYSQRALQLEHDIQRIVDMMERAGVPFDMKAAGALHSDLVTRKDELEKALVSQFGSWLAPISPDPTKYEVIPKVNNTKRGVTKGHAFCKLKRVTFNPGSRAHIAKVLKAKGWVPPKLHDSGNPEIDEPVIESIVATYPEMAGLGEFLMVEKRLSQLIEGKQSLIKSVKSDGRIHGVINPMGTTTSRGTHFHPNLSQVPSAKKPYGERFRALFTTAAGWVLVGADMDGLEGRGFGHYMVPLDGGAYMEALLKGDPHWASAKALEFVGGEEVRDKHNQLHVVLREGSKRFYYAFLYGAWDLECGNIILDTCNDARKAGFPGPYEQYFGAIDNPEEYLLRKVGGTARDRFLKRTPGMQQLLEKLETQVEQYGWLPGLDGRRIPVRSSHSALNFLVQSCGAILCKRWVVDAITELLTKFKHGWDGDFVLCLWVHDEIQVACRAGLEEEIGAIIVKHAKAAGGTYGFRVPLHSSYSVGRSWADTH